MRIQPQRVIRQSRFTAINIINNNKFNLILLFCIFMYNIFKNNNILKNLMRRWWNKLIS